MGVSREEIVWCYRALLGRAPESEAVVESHQGDQDFKRLVERIVLSAEFAAAKSASAAAGQALMSVVMPSFNQAAFIEESVRSVLRQDYQPLELIVMDGGSTDSTLNRLESLQGEFGCRLRWISERDSGPANAINKAFKLARGEFIGWLNSDDLYTPGAAATAARHLAANPDTLMVYGEGQHIDAQGLPLGRYPTRPPSASIQAFHDGCYICQPTVFLRREVFDAIGYLDESLGTAFDFDFWLRIFRRFPERIAYLDRLQACSRLHGDCITQRQRRQVAVEGVRLLARHVSKPRPHWLLTYRDEACASYPFNSGPVFDLRRHMAEIIAEVEDCFDSEALTWLSAEMARDARLKLALPGVFASVYPDGWAPANLALRLRGLPAGCTSISVKGLHAWPVFFPLYLTVSTSWGDEQRITIDKPGPFELRIPLPNGLPGESATVLIASKDTFVPRLVEPESTDGRQLAFKLEALCLND
jgi:glycosyltransferase involved in cell wall biosynthesis